MKVNIFKTIVILLMLAGSFSSCSQKECPKETVCNVNNPLTDLPWLIELINGYNENVKAGYKLHVQIYQCTYKNGTGFLVNDCVECGDGYVTLHNCEGEELCVRGGFVARLCEEYWAGIANEKLIWEIDR